MANEKDAIVRKAKIEIDVGRSERDVKSLTSQLKELQKQISSVDKLQKRAFGSYGKTQQRYHSKVLGIASSSLSSMDNKTLEELRLKLLSKIEKVQDKLLRKQEDSLKRQLDLERSIQQIRESRERSTKEETSQLEKQGKLNDSLLRSENKRKQTILQWQRQQEKEDKRKLEKEKQQRLDAARTIFEHNQSIRASRQSDLEFAFVQNPARMGSIVSKQNAKVISDLQKRKAESEERQRRIRNLVSEQNARAIATLQKRKAEVEEQLRRKMEEISSGGISGVVGGMFDPTLGNTISARWRNMSNNGVFADARRSALKRFGSQALWSMQGRIISAAYNTVRAGSEAAPKMEEWLAETQAIAGATSGSMKDLAKSIYEVASNSRYTTEELTRTTTVLAQAGYSAEDISKLLGSVNQLATATGTDLNRSVDLLTSSMSLWTSQTSDASKMVNALIVAVNGSKAEINSIQKGMQYAGAAASQMGMSFEETVAAMSAVTNAGLKTRSIMGTGLRAVLTELSAPSKKLQKELEKVGLTISDVNVRTKGFSNVIQTLAEAGFGAENAFRALDRQAASFYLALKSQLDLNNQLLETMDRRGVAEKAEQVRMDTTIAQLGRLKNIWFNILSTAGSPVNSAFKVVVESVADLSELLSSALEKFKGKAQDADSVIERTTAELDSMKTSAQALSEEMWKLAQQNIGNDAAKANKAHANLTDRFNNERKVVQGLSQDYKQLKQYMLDISVAQERESIDSESERIKANLQNVQKFSKEMKYFIGHSGRKNIYEDLRKLYSLLRFAPGESYQKVSAKIQTMPLEELQALVYELQEGKPIRGSIERVLTSRQEIQRGVTRITGAPSEETLRKELTSIAKIVDSTTGFMSGTQYKQLSDRLKDWSGENSQKDIATLLKTIDMFRSDMKTLDDLSQKYPHSIEIQTQTSTAREKLFENIQTLETQITNVATKAMEDIEKDLKNQSQTNKQGVIEKFMEKLEGMLGVSSSGKSWLDSTIEQLQNAKGDEGLIESLKQLREKVLSGLLKSAEVAYKNTIESAKLSAGVSEAALKYKKTSGGYDSRATALANLNYIQANLTATNDALESVKNARTTTYKEYSDEQFSSLTSPLEEQVVTLKLDEKQATEEAARLGINGTGFWDQTGNSMGQGARDFFNNINQQSAAYSLTLEGLNSVSSGLKNAFRAIATDGMKVSDAFKQMAQSILQSLANKAIDKGVDYMMFAVGQALPFAGTAAGASGGVKSGGPTISNSVPKNITPYPGAVGGLVTTQGIRRFAAGGGVVGRDSVPALLMPGEYVMKKSAVDMLGKETLDSLNRATSRVSDERASNIRESKSAKPVVTNVYVVSDAKEAGMTPNDVLVTISRDILQGGQTRELIQQVVQGRY